MQAADEQRWMDEEPTFDSRTGSMASASEQQGSTASGDCIALSVGGREKGRMSVSSSSAQWSRDDGSDKHDL